MLSRPHMKGHLCPRRQGTDDEDRGGPQNVGLLAFRPPDWAARPKILYCSVFLAVRPFSLLVYFTLVRLKLNQTFVLWNSVTSSNVMFVALCCIFFPHTHYNYSNALQYTKLRTLRDDMHDIDTPFFIIFYLCQNFVLPFLILMVLNFPFRMLEGAFCSVSGGHARFVLWLHMHRLQICLAATLMCLEHEFLVTAVVFMFFWY